MIAADTLQQIAQRAAASGALGEATLATLKQAWPDLRFTLCDDDDMPARMKPALSEQRFNLYLVGGGEHCLSLTDDPERAIGVVLAQVDEE
ncbi:MAG: hypothetical protein KKF58_06055 [Gammaproteobacteria bacterium]|nr:hypothetical protein [Gammaproteobacteria bacterium]MDD2929613.1 DUF6129 family protein [Sideroxydans sp.]